MSSLAYSTRRANVDRLLKRQPTTELNSITLFECRKSGPSVHHGSRGENRDILLVSLWVSGLFSAVPAYLPILPFSHPMHTFVRSFIRSFVRSFIHLFIYLFIHRPYNRPHHQPHRPSHHRPTDPFSPLRIRLLLLFCRYLHTCTH